jgi:stage V sporulation protein AD
MKNLYFIYQKSDFFQQIDVLNKKYGFNLTTAPAAAETIAAFFKDTGSAPTDYDSIITGDLGEVGSKSLCDLLKKEGYDICKNHTDCGLIIYDRKAQDVHSGGSGCGCCASVLCSKILNDLSERRLKNILFVATGALLSTTTAGQSKTIPSIAHLVQLTV